MHPHGLAPGPKFLVTAYFCLPFHTELIKELSYYFVKSQPSLTKDHTLRIQPITDGKYSRKTSPESSTKHNLKFATPRNYLHCIYYIVISSNSNLEMIQSIWKGVYRLCANTVPFT